MNVAGTAGNVRRRSAIRWVVLGLATFLVAGMVNLTPSAPGGTAWAGNGGTCEPSGGASHNDLKVYPSHGKVFYIDSGQNQTVDAAYAGYRVENLGTDRTNLWASVDTFTGGVVGLANPSDAYYPLGDISASETAPAYFLLQAGTSSTRAQSHVFRVYDGDPRLSGSSEIYNCTYTFSAVKETIKAAANKVRSLSSVSTEQLGGSLTVTVEGESGVIGSGTSSPDGQVLWFTPAARSNWPSSSLRLESTSIDFFSNPSRNSSQRVGTGPYEDRLIFADPATYENETKVFYTAVYTFSIVGPLPAGVKAIPIAQISSGTQIKHTNVKEIVENTASTISSSTSVTVGVSITGGSPVTPDGSDRLIDYTVELENSSNAVDLDQIVIELPDGLTFEPGSADYGGVDLPDPRVNSSGHLVFDGPLAATGSGTSTLTFQLRSTCSSGTFAYSTSAYATVGGLIVGANSSTLSGVSISGDCPATDGSVTVEADNRTIDPGAITQSASSLGEQSATLNGAVDPNGVSGQEISFVWGQQANLSDGTTVVLDATSTDGSDFYAVSTSLSSLASGTRYYFKVTIGNISGDILSFTTPEPKGTPTVVTNSPSAINPDDGSVTFNATVDPNQVDGGASVYFRYAQTAESGTSTTCPGVGDAAYGDALLVQQDEDGDGVFDDGAELYPGAFPAEASWSISGLNSGSFYCVYAQARWSTSSEIDGEPVLFQMTTVNSQTITFPTPTITDYNETETLSASSTSGLTVSYESNTPDVCTISGGQVTIVGGGTCSLTASQSGDTSNYPAEPVTVTFSITSYTVAYDLNGGSGNPPVDSDSPYASGQDVTISSTVPELTGYTFDGWTVNEDGSGTVYSSGGTLSSIFANVTLYAKWSIVQTYTLTYLNNGGTGAPATSSHNENTEVTVSATQPTRNGYRFDGWRNSAGSPVASESSFTITSNEVLTAQWVQVFSVSYDLNLGTGTPPETTTHDFESSPTVAVKPDDVERSGYSFGGWFTEQDGSGSTYAAGTGTIDSIDSNQVLFARWYATVSYDANEGSGSGPTDSTEYLPGASATVLGKASLERTGYTFAGWDTQPDGSGEAYEPNESLTIGGDQVLYAQWDRLTYSITYQANGGTGSVPTQQTFDYDGSATISDAPEDLEKTGFSFGGWNESDDGAGTNRSPGASYAQNSSIVLYAKWVAGVDYRGNGSTGGGVPTDTSEYLVNDVVTTLGNTGSLSRNGHTFAGWNTEPDGSGDPYAPGDTFTILENTSLYAQWTPLTYTVTFMPNSSDSGSAPDPIDSTGAASITVPGNPSNLDRDGFIFGGWNEAENGSGVTYSSGDSFTPSSDTQLWALWLTARTVSYDGNGNDGGNVPGDEQVADGANYTVQSNSGLLIRSGFTFAGWQSNPNGGTRYVAGSGTLTVSGDVRLYARWSATTSSGSSEGRPGGDSEGNRPSSPVPGPTVSPANPAPATPPGVNGPPTANPPSAENSPDDQANNPVPGGSSPNSPPTAPVSPGLRALLSSPGSGTFDFGNGIQESGSGSTTGAEGLDAGVRSIDEVASERLAGFAPGSGVQVEVMGARTGARFVVSSVDQLDNLVVAAAINESIDAQESDFFGIDRVQASTAPIPTQGWSDEDRENARALFEASGLAAPANLSDTPADGFRNWILVESVARTYLPGSTVYLTLTSEPIVFAQAVVGSDGSVALSGTFPAELLSAGEHRIRLVGIRNLDGFIVGDDGTLQVTPALLTEVERFDVGTQATIAIWGAGESGSTHTALRIIPLVPDAPWWTLWILAATFVMVVTAQRRRWIRGVAQSVIATGLILVSGVPAVILGWLSTVTVVAWWGLGLTLAAVVLNAVITVIPNSQNPHSRRLRDA